MDTAPAAMTKHDIETKLIERCWKDPEFKAKILADPNAMFEEFLGQKLPADFKILIHEDDAHTLNFTLPPAPGTVAELSDEELEQIAGGTTPTVILSGCLVTEISAATVLVTGTISAAAGHPWM